VGDETECFDCAVVGTGFGGAVTAHALAIAGFSVCLFERGRRFDPQTFPSLPQTPAMPLEGKDWFWNLDRGLIDIRHLGDLVVAQAAGYGGGSLIYANVHLRAPPEIFAQWPGGLTRAELDPY